jgi:hypothetical protein
MAKKNPKRRFFRIGMWAEEYGALQAHARLNDRSMASVLRSHIRALPTWKELKRAKVKR